MTIGGLRLAVFDLDYTVWDPEMYQLWGPPKLTKTDSPSNKDIPKGILKKAKTRHDGMIITDRSNTPMTVFEGASFALSEINRLKNEGHDIRAAVASRTDEADWADMCMKHLIVHDGSTLEECFDNLVEISFSDKTHHFKKLHERTGIAFENMAFFDNERWNIQCVSKLGVKCIYTPDGMTRKAWKEALSMF